jgi:hypothetical protein
MVGWVLAVVVPPVIPLFLHPPPATTHPPQPAQSAQNESLHDTLQELRAKFRVLASLLKLPAMSARVPGASAPASLSF